MHSRVWLGAAALLIIMAPAATALSGYYEGFNDANDSSGSQPVAEPVIWYVASTPSNYGRLHNAWTLTCSWTGQGYSACAGLAQDFNLQSGYTASGIDWTISVQISIHRKTDAVTTGNAGISVITAASVERNLGAIGYTGTSGDTLQVIRGSGAAPCTTVTTADNGRDHSDSFTFSYLASTTTLTVTDSIGGTCSIVNSGYGVVNAIKISIGSAATGTTDSDRDYSEYRGLVWNPAGNTGTYTLPVTPDAPAGLSAFVVDAWDGSSSETELRWPVSENDPDQDTGDFVYHVYCNGNELTGPTGDSITAQDGEGARYHSIVFGGALPTTCNYFIIAEDRGTYSDPSCSVQVDPNVLADFDSCGDTSGIGGPVGGGGTAHTTPTDTAAGLRGFCEGLMGDSDGSLFLCGLIMVATVFLSTAGAFAALVAGEKNRPVGNTPMIAGAVGGFGMMVFNVFAGIWGVVWAIVLIILVAAVATFVVRKATVGGGGFGE